MDKIIKKIWINVLDLYWYWPNILWKAAMKTAFYILAFFGMIFLLVLSISLLITVSNGETIEWSSIFFPHYFEGFVAATIIVFIFGIMVEVAKEQRHLISLHDPTRYFVSKPYNPPSNMQDGVGVIVTNYNSNQIQGIYARISSVQEGRVYLYRTQTNKDQTDLGWRSGRELFLNGIGSIAPYEQRIFEIANWNDKTGDVEWSVPNGGLGFLPFFDKSKEYIIHVEIHASPSWINLLRGYCVYAYKVKWSKDKLVIEEYQGKSYDMQEYKEGKKVEESNYAIKE
jgi:hypothetical protein